MRIGLIIVMLLLSITNEMLAQDWQTIFSVDSRVGYSTNTYLNPYYAEWDRAENTSFGALSGIGQSTWFGDKDMVELTGIAVLEPFFSGLDTWKGGLALARYQHQFSHSISGGIEVGGSYFNSSFSRGMFWAQPTFTWSPTPFSQLKVKAGSNFRSYRDYMVDSVATSINDRSDLYALEFETWPSFNWQLSTGLYGNFDSFPDIQQGFSSFVAASRIFEKGSKIRFKVGLEQYQNQQTVTTGGGGGGFPPVGGGPPETTETIEETNRIFRLGIEGSIPISQQLTAFVSAEGLRYNTTATDQNINDIQVSGGIRLTLQPKSGKDRGKISPDWNKEKDIQRVEISYSGDARIYLVGDFNNWSRPGVPLVNVKNDRYRAELELDPGSYEYKVLKIEGGEESWIAFSSETYTVEDGFGGQNALLLVQ
ncbi:glycogen-binding domain-containing protein [Fodinibius sp.]|uniref:glycogen-binding domain-containing protein n=1 Tax=Fodinibius sp. TaxID=1872440 RepID=UPI002ACD3347|nr:glycogen-binding domain-containing protein [Fodinibius sp.]MDZ7660366.1 glycogen-binding domain-containing protein [Fodinibius sp.]